MTSSDPMKAAEQLEKWAEGLEHRAQRYTLLQEQMNATSASAASPDGSVRVTVDSNGVPTEIALSDRTRGAEPGALSAQIMAGMRNAQAKLRQQVQALVEGTVPAGDEPARNLVAQYQQRFPEPVQEAAGDRGVTREMRIGRVEDDDTAPPPPPRRAPGGGGSDDDWGDQSFLR